MPPTFTLACPGCIAATFGACGATDDGALLATDVVVTELSPVVLFDCASFPVDFVTGATFDCDTAATGVVLGALTTMSSAGAEVVGDGATVVDVVDVDVVEDVVVVGAADSVSDTASHL